MTTRIPTSATSIFNAYFTNVNSSDAMISDRVMQICWNDKAVKTANEAFKIRNQVLDMVHANRGETS